MQTSLNRAKNTQRHTIDVRFFCKSEKTENDFVLFWYYLVCLKKLNLKFNPISFLRLWCDDFLFWTKGETTFVLYRVFWTWLLSFDWKYKALGASITASVLELSFISGRDRAWLNFTDFFLRNTYVWKPKSKIS